jgi:hypothetical protein
MRELRYTLVTDGSSDRALLPILSWLLREHGVSCPIQAEWAELRWLPVPPKELASRIERSLELFPCDLLFVHSDAESQTYASRKAEINEALTRIGFIPSPAVCVVPVRMLEAWMLFDETALRRAAGNPNGRSPLGLPDPKELEQLSDPKDVLYRILKDASGLKGRRLHKLRLRQSAQLVTGYIAGFHELRALDAFRCLEADVVTTVTYHQWNMLVE